MQQYIESFTQHLDKALNSELNFNSTDEKKQFKNILLCGLGGSGIGASILKEVLFNSVQIPILVNKDYQIPAFVDENTLVIVNSYSGNTEEAIKMCEDAEKRNSTIICIASGGKLIEMAQDKGFNYHQVEGGLPPRAAFGLVFPILFKVLNKLGIIDNKFVQDFSSAIKLINQNQIEMKEEANKIAEKLFNKIPVIYTTSLYEGVAIRFRQQINENSKRLGWYNIIPEMNHNELVGWAKDYPMLAVVFLRNSDEYFKNRKRIELNSEVIKKYASSVSEIHSKGDTHLEKVLYLIHLTDWISFYLAEKNQVDITEVDVITSLKNELNNI